MEGGGNQWGYLQEAMEVDGTNALKLLFAPCIDQDVHALFLQQVGQADPQALHVIIRDQAGFHLPGTDARVPANVRLLPLPPYSPELNPVEKLGDLVKDQICNRLYPNLRKLGDRILAALRPWRTTAANVAALIGEGWLTDGANSGAPALSLKARGTWYDPRLVQPVPRARRWPGRRPDWSAITEAKQ